MKVVLDTNILVSAVLRDRLPERVVRAILGNDQWEWLVTRDLLAEYERVIGRPELGIPLDAQEEWAQLVHEKAVQVDAPLPSIEFTRDRKDIHVLQAVVAGHADYLLTGDKDFSEAQKLVSCRIMTVAEFARLFGIT